jgi:hypothetical protein
MLIVRVLVSVCLCVCVCTRRLPPTGPLLVRTGSLFVMVYAYALLFTWIGLGLALFGVVLAAIVYGRVRQAEQLEVRTTRSFLITSVEWILLMLLLLLLLLFCYF